jgi:2-methylcitrate dehydratase PrpD
MSGATRVLAQFVCEAQLSVRDTERAARSRSDARRAITMGRGTAAGRRAAEIAALEGGADSPAGRAWLDAACAAASALDDDGDYGSAGAPVWAALEALGGSDDEVLVSGGIGIRAALGLWSAGRYREAERGFSAPTVFGVLATAAACARMLRLGIDETVATFAIAASQAGGLLVDDGTDARMLRLAAAARDGLQAAELAAAGFRGAPDMIEGRQGFGEAFFGLPLSDVPGLADALRASSLEGLRSKEIPGHADHQRPVAVLAQLLAAHPGKRVQNVIIDGVPPTSDGNRFAAPATPGEAARSLRHALAVTVNGGTVTLDDLENPLAASRLDAVTVRSAARWDPRLENPRFAGGRLLVEFDDGTTASVQVD